MKQLWKIIYFLNLLSGVLSEILVYRNKEFNTFLTWNHQSRKLFCTSDNYNDALIWNTHLDWINLSMPTEGIQRYSYTGINEDTFKQTGINCEFVQNSSCHHKWNVIDSNSWSFISTLKKPMSPVFDKRWEDFREYGKESVDEYWFMDKFENNGTVIFSVRGSSDAHLLLCSGDDYRNNSCFVIIIGGWNNRASVIRNCQMRVPIPPNFTSICPTVVEKNHNPLSSKEWRTFILSWNFTTKSDISLNDITTSGSIQNYTFKVDIKNYEQTAKNFKATYLFYRTMKPIIFRFHIYNYFQTTKADDELISPVFEVQKNFCIEITIGLCNECKMIFNLVHFHTNSNLISTELKSTIASFHKLPTWQNVRWNVTLASNIIKAQLKIITKLEKHSSNPLWAVHIIQECLPVDSLKMTVTTASQDYNTHYYWPNVTCQQLSYNGTTIVSSISKVPSTANLNDNLCPEGKIGKHCAINCRSLTENDNCAGVSICNQEGCMCPQGFIGETCNTPCDFGRYGFGCNQSCGNCSQNSACNYLTGECHQGCDKTSKFYLKPFCKIGIGAPAPPEITFLNETYVKASLPILDEYRKVKAQFSFAIQESDIEIGYIDISMIADDLQRLEVDKNNLTAGFSYKIRGIVVLKSTDFIFGEWRNFTTVCNATSTFKVTDIGKKGFKLTRFNTSSYLCPAKSYHVLLKTKKETIFSGIINYPYEFENLSPFTTYDLSITRNETTYYSKSIQTLIAAPTKVRSLEVIFVTQSEVSLQWKKPKKENGVFEKYEISVQPLEFFGCFNKTLPPTEKIRNYTSTSENIHIQNLHPYTKYYFEIAARVGDNLISITGIPIGINFTTNYTEIPTAVFSNLRLLQNKLIWDPPKNCFTISGPIRLAKLIFTGSSESVITYQDERETADYYFILGSKNQTIYGAEYYFVYLYIARVYNGNVNINNSNYQRIKFLTSPKAPPPVRNLDIYEVDTRDNTTSLRWQPPNPPTNGEIIFYIIQLLSGRQNKFFESKILPNETCKLWNEYICATVKQPQKVITQIMIFAHNRNVNEAGDALQIINDNSKKEPDAPSNVSTIIFPKGIVHLFWTHPWKSGEPIEKFLIYIKLISTKLKSLPSANNEYLQEHVISKYNLTYNTHLFLLSSSEYEISIQTLTFEKSLSRFENINVRTPSATAFSKEIQTIAYYDNSTISVIIPEVINSTIDDIMYVIVKGPKPCENYSIPDESIKKLVNMKYYEISWCAASFTSENYTKEEFSIGDNKTSFGGSNCVLYSENTYVVFIVVKSNDGRSTIIAQKSIFLGKNPRVLYEVWLILALVLIIVPLLFYFFYFRGKKVQKNDPNNIPMTELQKVPHTEPEMNKIDEDVLPESEKLKTDDEKFKLIEVQDFEDYVKEALNSGELREQFENMPQGLIKSVDYGKLERNKNKNRYANVFTYDETRVILETLSDDPSSDYINASHVDNTGKDRCYIATQGPKPNTVIDFWRMVWQEKVSVICMVVNIIENDKIKCEQYWPEVSKRKIYGDIVVENIEETVSKYYTSRIMNVTRCAESRKVMHLQYTAWPDHGIPLHTYSLVSFMQKMLTISTENTPMIVHCSAGIGRTGAIILLDICLHQAANKGAINVQEEFENIRQQRYVIENIQQYLFVHLILLEYLFSLSTNIPCDENLSMRIEEMKKNINNHEERLKEISWRDEILEPFVSKKPLSKENLAKNRFPNLANGNRNKVYLKRYPVTDEDSDYISAVHVDGIKAKNQYFATQLPLPSTLSDFWRMIVELRIETIIMLQSPDREDRTCCELIPDGTEFNPVAYLNISVGWEVVTDSYRLKNINIVDQSEKVMRQQSVILFVNLEWKAGINEEMPKPESLVTLWQTVNKIQHGELGPQLIMCYDGVNGCGLYLALSFLLERMKTEEECDIIYAIRAIRKSHSDFVKSTRQFEFLYDAALCFHIGDENGSTISNT